MKFKRLKAFLVTNDSIPRKNHDRQQDGRTERSHLYDPSSYYWGSNKYKCSRLAPKSERYRGQCWSNQTILRHSQHAKNQLNS